MLLLPFCRAAVLPRELPSDPQNLREMMTNAAKQYFVPQQMALDASPRLTSLRSNDKLSNLLPIRYVLLPIGG